VSFKLWNDEPEHLALADFGLGYSGEGWYITSMTTENLQNGPYRLTATVYNWQTGERLKGIFGEVTGKEIAFMDLQLPLHAAN
jgi:hypothetical protein